MRRFLLPEFLMTDAELAFLSWLAAEEKQRQKDIVLARNYYEGVQGTELSARMLEVLNAKKDHEFNFNVCRGVISAVEERLIINEIDTDEIGDDVTSLNLWANSVWDASKGDIVHATVHEGALRDGEYFIIVDWDDELQMPVFIPHQRFADATVNGDGFGCKAHYPDDDTNLPMEYASKRWIERIDQHTTKNRMNLYYPDRVEKYEHNGADWVAFQAQGEPWPIPRVDSAGNPLGIQVIHFRNTADIRPEHWDAIPLQRGLIKLVIDLLAAGDFAGFKLLVAFGWQPDANTKVAPGQIFGSQRTKNEASLEAIDASDLNQLVDSIQAMVGWVSVTTSTPASKLAFSAQVQSEGSQQEQKEGLFAKTRRRQNLYNDAWIQCFEMARTLQNTFGQAVDEEPSFVPMWEPLQSRDTQDERDEWRAKKDLGVPLEQLWSEMGYSAEQIQAMKQTEEYKARISLMTLGLGSDGEEDAG